MCDTYKNPETKYILINTFSKIGNSVIVEIVRLSMCTVFKNTGEWIDVKFFSVFLRHKV
jgi:hypothetical protein